ncbi:Ectoine dioxygenase [Balamuthia mandrillaris]
MFRRPALFGRPLTEARPLFSPVRRMAGQRAFTVSAALLSEARMDHYPSRMVQEPHIIPRKDPVLWGTEKRAGPLTREQLEFYRDNGFLVLNGIFSSAEVAFLSEELTTMKHNLESKITGDVRIDSKTKVVSEPGTNVLRSIFEVHKFKGSALGDICKDSRLVERARQILDDDLYIHQSRVNFQPSFTGTGFSWHSDFGVNTETWHTEDGMPNMRALSCVVRLPSIVLEQITYQEKILLARNIPQNGALMVIPSSHKRFVACVGETEKNNWEKSLKQQQYLGTPDRSIVRQLADKNGITYCQAEAGSIIMFDCNLLHGSHTNISPWDRMNIFMVFNALSNKLGAPFASPSVRPEHIATREPEWVRPIDALVREEAQ